MRRIGHESRARARSLATVSLLILLGSALWAAPSEVSAPRYPSDLCIDPTGRWIFTANEESGSVSMLSLASGEVVDEMVLDPAGRPVLRRVPEGPAELAPLRTGLERAGSRAGDSVGTAGLK